MQWFFGSVSFLFLLSRICVFSCLPRTNPINSSSGQPEIPWFNVLRCSYNLGHHPTSAARKFDKLLFRFDGRVGDLPFYAAILNKFIIVCIRGSPILVQLTLFALIRFINRTTFTFSKHLSEWFARLRPWCRGFTVKCDHHLFRYVNQFLWKARLWDVKRYCWKNVCYAPEDNHLPSSRVRRFNSVILRHAVVDTPSTDDSNDGGLTVCPRMQTSF